MMLSCFFYICVNRHSRIRIILINLYNHNMKKLAALPLAFVFSACMQTHEIQLMPYPQTKKVNVADNYFDIEVKDPYRWLENDTAADTKQWVKEENRVTQDYLSQIPYRDKIRERLEKLWNYEKYSAPFKEGKYTYFFKNDGLQNQSVLYRETGDGKSEVFLDPNTFSADGTTSLAGIDFSKDGTLAAYMIS